MDHEMQEAILADLSHALRELATAERAMPVGPDGTGRLLRLARTITALGGLQDETLSRLRSARDFAAFVMSRVSEEQADVIRPVVVEWLEAVRAQAE